MALLARAKLDVEGFVMASQKHKVGKRLRAYLTVIARHNALAVQEVIDMGGTAAVDLETVLRNTGLIAKWKAEARIETRIETQAEWEAKTLNMARFFIEQGIPIDTVASGTGLDPELVRELADEIYK